MKELVEILKNTPVSALINAKPMKKKNFICLDERDTIRTALITFITHDIESVPIKKFKGDVEERGIDKLNECKSCCSDYCERDQRSDEFSGIISLMNFLKFIFSSDPSIPVTELLNFQIKCIVKEPSLVQRIEFVRPEMSLMHLLLHVWGGACNPKTNQIDCEHLLTTTNGGKYDVITPLDFLRHLLFINIKAIHCLQTSLAAEIENGIDVDENSTIFWGQDARVTVNRMLHSEPSFLIAIVSEETGALEANLTFSDLLPRDISILDESISMIRRGGNSIYSYLHTIHTTLSPKSAIDPILIYSHFTIYDLIEKLTRLRIHHLWRVTPDANKQPIGAVGVNDILRYLFFMFRPFFQDKLPKGQLTIQF